MLRAFYKNAKKQNTAFQTVINYRIFVMNLNPLQQ